MITNSPLRRRSLDYVEIVIREVRSRILSGEYARGEKLPTETQLQELWSVSRPVVREAMKVLASQGLVRIEQGRGTFVAEKDSTALSQQLEWALLREGVAGGPASGAPDQWDSLLDVRFALEVRAAENAAGQNAQTEWGQMAASIAAMRAHPSNAVSCGEDDLEFHTALARATRNPLYPMLIGSLHGLLGHYLRLTHHGRDNALKTARQHQEILDAVRAGQVELAAAAMRTHLQATRNDLDLARSKGRLDAQN